MSELILHHYEISPFSEKIRLILGLKRLEWRSVLIPPVLPKPDLVALTGGYRHTPVLQIGADIFCDTRLIACELERRHPTPSLWSVETEGLARAIEAWGERDLFWPIARYVSGRNAIGLGSDFHADRAALRGKPAPTPAALESAAQRSLAAMRAEIPRVESMLSDGRNFLLGASATLADFAVYHGFWFLSALPVDCSAEIARYARIRRWMERVAAIGHGRRMEIDAKAAQQTVAAARPAPVSPAPLDETAPALGTLVSVRAEGYETEAVEGELVLVGPNEVALRRRASSGGEVMVHFPRLGYALKALS